MKAFKILPYILISVFSLPCLAAVTSAQISLLRSRINTEPENCGLITSPVPTNSNTNINNSVKLRAAVLDDMIKHMDSQCLSMITQNLALKSQSDPVTADQMKMILAAIDARSEKVTARDEVFCYNASSGIEELLELAKAAEDVNECRPMNLGQSMVVNKWNSPSFLPGAYTLIRSGETKWTVALALDVESGNEISGDEMFNRVKKCMATANQAMKGPSGETIDFKILNRSENRRLPYNKRAPLSSIKIEPVGTRSHSRAYAADIDCPTIVHEVLHLLGLCDEYEANYDGYQCRAVPSVDSIMKNQTTVFNQTIPRQLTCECTDDECQKIVNARNAIDIIRIKSSSWSLGPANYEFQNKYCRTPVLKQSIPFNRAKKNFATPAGTLGFKATLYDVFANSLNRMSPTELTCTCPAGDNNCLRVRDDVLANLATYGSSNCPSGSNEIKTAWGTRGTYSLRPNGFTMPGPKPTRSSILEPVHFNRIIGGACNNITPQYNECSKWAYKGSTNQNDCSSQPAYCRNDDWMK
jgi:hypothetical protein